MDGRAQEEQALLAEVARRSPDAYLLVDGAGTITWASPQIEDLLGHTPAEVIGKPVEALVPAPLREAHVTHRRSFDGVGTVAMGGGRYLPGLRSDGAAMPLDIRLSRVDGGLVLAVLRDAADRKALEDELVAQATTDPLTGLANRRAVVAHLEEALARTRRRDDHLAVCYLDLDDFKGINDRFGHEAGDLVLVAAARALRESTRFGDHIGRIGGDELVVVLEELGPDPVQAEAAARHVAERSVAAIHRPVRYAGTEIEPRTSVGVVVAAGVLAGDSDDLLRAADAALYQAKRHSDRPIVVVGSPGDRPSTPVGQPSSGASRAARNGRIDSPT